MAACVAHAESLKQSHNPSMKVLDLQCSHLHTFEGWFASGDDFQDQQARGLLTCPVCNDKKVVKLLSAPRLNLGATDSSPLETVSSERAIDPAHAAQATWLKVARRLIADTEDVGERFAEMARRMHYGEAEERGIRGKTSPEEAEALLDEGIPVLPLLLPRSLEEPLQ
jgi:hypothetical protein